MCLQHIHISQYYGYVLHSGETVRHDEVAQSDFIAQFDLWHNRNKSIYRNSFKEPESIYYHEYEENIYLLIIVVDIIKDYRDDIRRLSNHIQADIERVDLIDCIAYTAKVTTPTEKPYKIFISHSSKDGEFVGHLVDVLEMLGIDRKNKLFCSSILLYGIDLSEKIFETLLSQFNDYRL